MNAFGSVDAWVLVLRWIHLVAILGWVGTSLYFMWLESKLRTPQPADADVIGEAWMGHGGGFYAVQKRRIGVGRVPDPVWWFRNEAAITWVTGFLLLVLVYYRPGGLDLVRPGSSLGHGAAVALAIGLIVVCWFVYDRLWIAPAAERHPVAFTIVSLLLLLVLVFVSFEVFTGRAAVVHVGAVIGTHMVFSVWTRIIPSQEEAVAATTAGRDRDMRLAHRARRRAQHNTYMTLPVLVTMLAAHAPIVHASAWNAVLVVLLIAAGIAARQLMILYDRREPSAARWSAAGVPMALSVVAIAGLTAHAAPGTPSQTAPVSMTVVRGIVELRCGGCHGTHAPEAPAGGAAGATQALRLASAQELSARAAAIRLHVVQARTMPPGNATRMTDEERMLIGRWVDGGARMADATRP